MGLKELGLLEMEEVSQEQEDTTSEFEYQDILFGTEEEDNKKEKTSINNILKAKITNYTNGLQVESVISSLESGYYIIPKFQRRFVWKKVQVENLALSIIKQVPIPPLYLYLNEKKKHVVLDGQQRVTAMFLYFNDLWYTGKKEYERFDFREINRLNKEVLELEEQLYLAKSSGKTRTEITQLRSAIKEVYNELKAKHGIIRSKFFVDNNGTKQEITFSTFDEDEREFLLRRRIDITIVECRSEKPQKVYADIFKLLNSGGKLLGSQEIRNGIYWELPLYDRLFLLNKNENWRMVYGKESDYSKDMEILLKMLALNYFTSVNMEYSKESQELEEVVRVAYDGTFNWSNIMDEYSFVSQNWSHERLQEELTRLEMFLNSIEGITEVGEKCNKAVFEALFVALCKKNICEKIEYKWLHDLAKEKEFQKGNVLSNKTNVEGRLTKALKMVKERYNV